MIYYQKNGNVVRTSNKIDVEMMQGRLRQSDIDEVWASHHHSPKEALILSLEQSELCLTIDIKGMPVAMFGINSESLLSDKAVVWLLATDRLNKVSKSFLKECPRFIKLLLSSYPVLENYVSNENKESIKWLRQCGAILEEPKPYGIEKALFRYFYFKRAATCQC